MLAELPLLVIGHGAIHGGDVRGVVVRIRGPEILRFNWNEFDWSIGLFFRKILIGSEVF